MATRGVPARSLTHWTSCFFPEPPPFVVAVSFYCPLTKASSNRLEFFHMPHMTVNILRATA